MQGVIIMGPC